MPAADAALPAPAPRRRVGEGLRLYPAQPGGRTRAIAHDVAVLAVVLLFAWIGMVVHDGVAELASLGRGVSNAGNAVVSSGRTSGDAVRDALGGAGRAIGGAPLVGGQLQGALEGAGNSAGDAITFAGSSAGGQAVSAGREGERRVYELANLLGWLAFLLPTGVLLLRVLPARVAQVRRLTAAQRVLGVVTASPERDAVLAQRALYSLPFPVLLRHTRDPVGDLLAGRHAGLVAALEDAEGVTARTTIA